MLVTFGVEDTFCILAPKLGQTIFDEKFREKGVLPVVWQNWVTTLT